MKLLSLLFLALAAFAFERDVAVIAHRGEHFSHPENTIPSLQAAIEAGADFVECDVRTTSDGHLVLMHDTTVDRTTNGKGKVSDLSIDHIRALRAGDANIPAFEEALRLAKGRSGVYVDYKDASPEAIVAAIDKAGMSDSVVIYGAPSKLAAIHALRREWRIMPEAISPARLGELIATLRIRIAAFDQSDFQPDTIEVARKARIDIFVDCLGKSDTEQGWASVLKAGATGIQTDHPAELVAYLRARGLHR